MSIVVGSVCKWNLNIINPVPDPRILRNNRNDKRAFSKDKLTISLRYLKNIRHWLLFVFAIALGSLFSCTGPKAAHDLKPIAFMVSGDSVMLTHATEYLSAGGFSAYGEGRAIKGIYLADVTQREGALSWLSQDDCVSWGHRIGARGDSGKLLLGSWKAQGIPLTAQGGIGIAALRAKDGWLEGVMQEIEKEVVLPARGGEMRIVVTKYCALTRSGLLKSWRDVELAEIVGRRQYVYRYSSIQSDSIGWQGPVMEGVDE